MYRICVDVARDYVPIGLRDREAERHKAAINTIARAVQRALTGK